MVITCIKCGHQNPDASEEEGAVCPACGVIYAKARQTAARPVTAFEPSRFQEDPGWAPSTLPAPLQAQAAPAAQDYLAQLRIESHYPAFRSVVRGATLFAYVAAGLMLLLGLVSNANSLNVGKVINELAWTGLMLFLIRVGSELCSIIADMSDAALRTAERMDER